MGDDPEEDDDDDCVQPFRADDDVQGDQPYGSFEDEDELLEVHDEDGDGPEAYEARDWGDYGEDDTGNSMHTASDVESSITETPTAIFEDVVQPSSSFTERHAFPNVVASLLKRKKKKTKSSSTTTFKGPLLQLENDDDE
jgi:hypothetical protein